MWPVVAAVGAGVLYKVIQAVTDEVFPGTEFPASFRREIIDEHWKWHGGGYCPECGRKSLRKCDLTVDHIVPIRKGGKNSRNNARVICRRCNSAKGAKLSLVDSFVGRGGSRPRRRKR